MRRVLRGLAYIALGISLAGCGLADSQVSFIPDRFKLKAPEAPQPDPVPDVKSLVRDRTAELFSGKIDAVAVSPPKPDGVHWQFCARPSGHGVGGQPLSAQTYLIEIENNMIGDRQSVGSDHWCNKESFESIAPKA